MWSLDQHDKFKHYGLFFHVSLDPFPGVIHWCKVWWTVRNPKLIMHFYLDTTQSIGGNFLFLLIRPWTLNYSYLGIPLVTQSDPGTENVNIANAQTMLCHDGSFSRWVNSASLVPEAWKYQTWDSLVCFLKRLSCWISSLAWWRGW